jgi:ABC-2 type transport system permease protein
VGDRLAVYGRLLRAQIRSQTQYRASYVLDLVLNAALTLVDVATILVVFRVTPRLAGFSLTDTLVVAGIARVGFQLADLVVGNVERVPFYLRTGQLDAVLLRPLSALGQLVVGDFSARRIGRVAEAGVVYAIALSIGRIDWTPGRVLLAAVAPLAAAVTYGGIFVAGGAAMFWLLEGAEVVNAFTYGGRDFGAYPTPVYGVWFGRVMGYLFGLASVGYLPGLALLDRADPLGLPGWLAWCSPVVALGWAGVAALAWRFGIRHYRSTGS